MFASSAGYVPVLLIGVFVAVCDRANMLLTLFFIGSPCVAALVLKLHINLFFFKKKKEACQLHCFLRLQ